MKLLITLFSLILTSIIFSQNYSSPKPQTINTYELSGNTANTEKFEIAWFFPAEKFLIAKKFEKMEIGISLPQSVNEKIQAFFNNSVRADYKINPFNRKDINIKVDFVQNGVLKHTSYGFYYEEFSRDLAHNIWQKDTTTYNFRVRFAPKEVGKYLARVHVEGKQISEMNLEFSFEVEESTNPGYLEIGENGKHMRFSESKKSFLGVGQDIPWPKWEDWEHLEKAIGPKPVQEMYTALNAFDRAKGNYTRFVASTWFLQLEMEALGNYAPRLGQAWEFDRMMELCEKRSIYFMFCALLHTPLESRPDERANQLPGVRWETYCYNDKDQSPAEVAHEQAIGISKAIDFYKNPKANEHTKNYFRYLVSRYGYSTSLAGWQLMSEVDETAEYRDVEKNGTIEDHSENRLHVRNWTNTMSTYLRDDLMDGHLISIAIIKGKGYSKTLWDPELFNLPNIDFFGYHDYMYETNPSEGKTRNRNSMVRYSSVNELNIGLQNGSITYPNFQKKLFIYDEFGHFLAIPKVWPEDDKEDPTTDFNNCIDFMIKQDLWFTFSSGCAVAGLDWWNHDQAPRHKMWEKYYPGILKFTEDIDFENINYTKIREVKGQQMIAQRWPLTEKEINNSNYKNYRKNDLLEAYTQVSSTQDQAFGWMSNRSVNWFNLKDDYPCLNSLLNGTEPYAIPYLYPPKDDDLTEKPIDIQEDYYFIKVYNLLKSTDYEIQFYNTVSGEKLETKTVRSNFKGVLKVRSPEMSYLINPDVAYKIIIAGSRWK